MALAFLIGNVVPSVVSSARAAEPQWVSLGGVNGTDVHRLIDNGRVCYLALGNTQSISCVK